MRIGSMLLVAALSATAACSGGGDASDDVDAGRPVVSTSIPNQVLLDPPDIGDGRFQRVVVREDAIDAGFEPQLVDEILGDRGVGQFTIEFRGPRYAQFQRTSDGPADLGDEGGRYVDEIGHLVLVSASPGAGGAASVLDWTLVGDELTMTCVAGCRRDQSPDANLVMEGTWTKSA